MDPHDLRESPCLPVSPAVSRAAPYAYGRPLDLDAIGACKFGQPECTWLSMRGDDLYHRASWVRIMGLGDPTLERLEKKIDPTKYVYYKSTALHSINGLS